jgi:hypothetical protein
MRKKKFVFSTEPYPGYHYPELSSTLISPLVRTEPIRTVPTQTEQL